MNYINPGLFGLKHSNRDFTMVNSWGKNQFNSSFPASLVCYMGAKNLDLVYLTLDETCHVKHQSISVEKLLGLPFDDDGLFFSFEEGFTPYADLVVGQLPRADLVTRNRLTPNKDCLAAFEIKLTALPDNSTCHLIDEGLYGCEIVIRPDTIVYIALGIAQLYAHNPQLLKSFTTPICSKIVQWKDAVNVRPYMVDLVKVIDNILMANLEAQVPLLLQPVWKTNGKSAILAHDCFEVFIWSNFSLTRLFTDQALGKHHEFSRLERAVIWLVKMLDDFANEGQINPAKIIDGLTYNTRNDKAFAVNGRVTHPYMQSNVLTKPRISKYALKEIILGGGQNYLSPERRLDAIIVNSYELFD